MSKDIILHNIRDWSKIDERESFWGKVDLLTPNTNFGIHRYSSALWTSGQVGVGRLFDREGMPIQDNGKDHVLVVTSSYDLNPWLMLESVLLDDEYEAYLAELEKDGRYLFRIFYDQPVIRLPHGFGADAETLFALSFASSCYALCKKGLKKSLIHYADNFTAKLRGKVDVSRNIKHNSAKGRSDRFFCRYIDFTEDNIENRIIKAALIKCKEIIRHRFQEDTSIRKKVLFCLNSLRHVKDTSVTNSDFNSAEVSGLYSYYKPVLQQARAILGFKFQSYSDAPVGTEERPVYTIPFVINMETLFEYYARTVLKRTFSEDCYRIEKYSRKLFLQRDVYAPESSEKGIHLMPFCIPDIIVLRNETPALVIDAKYKVSGRPDRADSHQLLAYVLLTGVDRCAFVLPNTETKIREMETTGDQFLTLASQNIRYYEMLLGHDYDPNTLKSVLM